MNPIRRVLIYLAPIFTVGCVSTPSYTVRVDGIADNSVLTETFIIKSGVKDVGENDLRFKEFAKIATNTLIKKGFKPSADIEHSDVVLMLSYGISDPQTRSYTRSIPVYGGQNNTTTVVKNNWGQQIGSFTTQPSNPYAPTGYQSVTDEVTTYNRFILVTAYDTKAVISNSPPKMVWETEITSSGSSGDLRKVFPVMMIGALPYLGENTDGQQVVDLELDVETDPRVLYLKREPRTPASKGR